jgi:hypothetical protein
LKQKRIIEAAAVFRNPKLSALARHFCELIREEVEQ